MKKKKIQSEKCGITERRENEKERKINVK